MGATSMTKPYAVLLLACLVLLGACSRDEPPAAQAPANESADTALGKVAEKVRTKLEHENITLSSSDAEAKAEITPQGDLLIGGKEVATDEAQREDRKSGGWGKSVSVRVDLGGRRMIKKKNEVSK